MNDETNRPINLSELDPTRDTSRFESLVEGIMRGAANELAERRAANNVVGELAQWRIPVLTAAAAAAMFLIFSSRSVATPDDSVVPSSGIAEAIGVPTEFAQWLRGETQPSVADIYEGASQ